MIKSVYSKISSVCLLGGLMSGCQQPVSDTMHVKSVDFKAQTEWVNLLDKDLSQFERYLSYAHKNGYDGSQPKDAEGNLIEPIGLEPEGYDVFTVSMESGEPVLRVDGKIYGSVTTKKSFRNYHFQLQFKWGEAKYEPRLDLLKDSGILYHAQGPHGGEYFRSWKLSQEFQIMEGHVGDYWSQATSAIDIRAFTPEYIMNPIADLERPFISVGEGEEIKGYVMRRENREIREGWNTLDLICFEGQSLHIVNGEVVMVLKNSRYIDNGVSKPLDEGQIMLQSEATELYYKGIRLRKLDAMPDVYAPLFVEG